VALHYLDFVGLASETRPARRVAASAAPAWTPMRTPVARARVALLSSAAVRLHDQPPFQPPEDTSYRAVPIAAPAGQLRLDHTSPVGTDARRDLEIVLPRRALRDLAEQGVIGGVAPACYTFVGGTRLHAQVEQELAPALAGQLAEAGVDLALLAPY
jgi:hypothetical protein